MQRDVKHYIVQVFKKKQNKPDKLRQAPLLKISMIFAFELIGVDILHLENVNVRPSSAGIQLPKQKQLILHNNVDCQLMTSTSNTSCLSLENIFCSRELNFDANHAMTSRLTISEWLDIFHF